jgi:hypothetical protein
MRSSPRPLKESTPLFVEYRVIGTYGSQTTDSQRRLTNIVVGIDGKIYFTSKLLRRNEKKENKTFLVFGC